MNTEHYFIDRSAAWTFSRANDGEQGRPIAGFPSLRPVDERGYLVLVKHVETPEFDPNA